MSDQDVRQPFPSGAMAIKMSGVERRFGDVVAVSDLDLEVPAGSITGLLGPNGAGKTTAIRLITGALTPTAGTVNIFGLDPAEHGTEVRRRCGIVSAKPALYDRLTGRDNLTYAAQLFGLGRRPTERIEAAAARFGIDHALDQQVGAYSTGMKTRLALSRSVLHDPELLLLDEPTSGLDPESSLAVLELIGDMTAAGTTVLLCTHLLLEAEGITDQVVVLDAGTDVATGSAAELTRQHWPDPHLLVTSTDPAAPQGLANCDGVVAIERQGDTLIATLDNPSRVPAVISELVAAGVAIEAAEPFAPTLEELYFAMRGLDTGLLRRPVPALPSRDADELGDGRDGVSPTLGDASSRDRSTPFAPGPSQEPAGGRFDPFAPEGHTQTTSPADAPTSTEHRAPTDATDEVSR